MDDKQGEDERVWNNTKVARKMDKDVGERQSEIRVQERVGDQGEGREETKRI